MLLDPQGLRRTWQTSRMRELGRRAALEVMARRPVVPHGVSHIYFHAMPDEEVCAFERFIDELRDTAPIVGLEEALTREATGDESPCFTISFDDGYLDNYTNAAKLLYARGISSTVFVIGELIGLRGDALADFTRERIKWHVVRRPLTHDTLKRCSDLGMRIGSHTMSHRLVTELTEDEARHEMTASRELLQSIINAPVTWFCWPAGKIAHAHLLRETGYTHGFSGAERALRDSLPKDVLPRRHLDLSWGQTICRYFALRG